MSNSRRTYRAIKKAILQLYPTKPQGNLARHLVTFGEAGPMIARVVEKSLNGGASEPGTMLEKITQVETLEEAVEEAARLAQTGDIVLLSPGGTSFDAFRDFAERGDRFKALVGEL